MFSLGMLAALSALTAFAGYQYSKAKHQNNNSATNTTTTTNNSANSGSDSSTAKNVNTYNYYTNESENGNTLFGSQKKTKRTLFGNEAV